MTLFPRFAPGAASRGVGFVFLQHVRRIATTPLGLLLLLCAHLSACSSAHITAGTQASAPDPLLDTIQSRTFRWFWDYTNPLNGLTRDRAPTPSFSSIAAVGFALTAYPIGVERGYVGRTEAAQRALTTLRFFWTAPQGPEATGRTGYKGFFYHFLDMNSGARFKDVELSTIDTSLLLAGALVCAQYFDRNTSDETAVRAYADSLYRRVDWQWFIKHPPLVNMGWTPESGFNPSDWHGLNEGMILYVLALGSPTHPAEPAAWAGYTSTYRWGDFYGQPHVGFAPLFGHQYSHAWIDFRSIQDDYMRARGIDYFENSRRATLAQRGYAIANPNGWKAYGADIWGLTASDGPYDGKLPFGGKMPEFYTYAARGADFTEVRDDGTVAPTAAGGSVTFAPEVAIPALRYMRNQYGDALFNQYGFMDAFNPSFNFGVPPKMGHIDSKLGWIDDDQLGIDQGPILIMIENYRSGLIWQLMRKNPYIIRGLQRAGFTGGWLTGLQTSP